MLADYIRVKGGQILLANKVKRILINNNQTEGVELEGGRMICASAVVSNADATSTFTELVEVESAESTTVRNLSNSPSMFAVYLSLDINLFKTLRETANILYFSEYNVTKSFFNIEDIIRNNKLPYLVFAFSSSHDECQNNLTKSTIALYVLADYKTPDFWIKYKENLAEMMIEKGKSILPEICDHICAKLLASPSTFYKFTLNKGGSYAGWTSEGSQFERNKLCQRTSVKKLYCAGHWYTSEYIPTGGVPLAGFSGRRAAQAALEDLGLTWNFGTITL
jgi:phytoene dehydrogenase-like protein